MPLWISLVSGGAVAVFNYCTGVAMHPLVPPILFAWALIADAIDKLQHSHVRTSFGPLNYVIASGAMHQIHHSAELRHRNRNYGTLCAVYDWMFGTIYIPQPDEAFRLGLNEEQLGPNNPHKRLLDIYLEPLANARAVLRGR